MKPEYTGTKNTTNEKIIAEGTENRYYLWCLLYVPNDWPTK